MLNLKETLELTDEQKNIIQSLEPLTKECCDKHETKLRKAIRASLMLLQNNFCVYCGCPVHEPEDVEHIAEIADTSGDTVKFPDNDTLDLSGLDVCHHPLEVRALCIGSRVASVLVCDNLSHIPGEFPGFLNLVIHGNGVRLEYGLSGINRVIDLLWLHLGSLLSV